MRLRAARHQMSRRRHVGIADVAATEPLIAAAQAARPSASSSAAPWCQSVRRAVRLPARPRPFVKHRDTAIQRKAPPERGSHLGIRRSPPEAGRFDKLCRRGTWRRTQSILFHALHSRYDRVVRLHGQPPAGLGFAAHLAYRCLRCTPASKSRLPTAYPQHSQHFATAASSLRPRHGAECPQGGVYQ